jgi:hypothetical protein
VLHSKVDWPTPSPFGPVKGDHLHWPGKVEKGLFQNDGYLNRGSAVGISSLAPKLRLQGYGEKGTVRFLWKIALWRLSLVKSSPS